MFFGRLPPKPAAAVRLDLWEELKDQLPFRNDHEIFEHQLKKLSTLVIISTPRINVLTVPPWMGWLHTSSNRALGFNVKSTLNR